MSQLAELYAWGWSPYREGRFLVHLCAATLAPEAEGSFEFPLPEEDTEWPVSVSTFRRARTAMLGDGYLTEVRRGGRNGPMQCRFEYPATQPVYPRLAAHLAAHTEHLTGLPAHASPLIELLNTLFGTSAATATPSPRGKATRKKSETPFPVGQFVITAEMHKWVEGSGFGRLNLRLETERFRDHALTHDRRVRDWVAAWRNWIRKAAEFQKVEKVPIQDTIKPLVWDPEADYAK